MGHSQDRVQHRLSLNTELAQKFQAKFNESCNLLYNKNGDCQFVTMTSPTVVVYFCSHKSLSEKMPSRQTDILQHYMIFEEWFEKDTKC